ncbi:variable surface lipoprotein [Mycoplasma sp. ES3157-GEN-MYC]|uniref:variable surface lipoprotein n=1 Tax=Mycoplasma miroungigenitalium TaxID=754515 RepID=UPI001C120571|nr:variable surface lipoprotein [Mycoplasma miroungigenitalium]MBU4690680.1 variable surface lipoprotein [Mycoplasma miroungigenitalium]MBU4691949.1 variable surface lipoprotein [Mycoplasma miroungigenitalium]
MKRKLFLMLGGVAASMTAIPAMAASCAKKETHKNKDEDKTTTQLVTMLEENKKAKDEPVDKKSSAQYQDMSDIDLTTFKLTIVEPLTEDNIGEHNHNKQVFINTFKGETKIIGKSTGKPWEGPTIATMILPDKISLVNADKPLYFNKKDNSAKGSGFITVVKDTNGYLAKFRLFKYDKGGNHKVSTAVYSMYIK